jgi:hypothetical protein
MTDDDRWDDEPEQLDDDESELAGEAEVACPYCGEVSVIAIDPGGGPEQEYVEDCQVCCRPWQVHVRLDDDGTPEVWVSETG